MPAAEEPARRTRRVLIVTVALIVAAFAATQIEVPGSRRTGPSSAQIEALLAVAPVHFAQSLPGAELLDVAAFPDVPATTAFESDAAVQVEFTYRREDRELRFRAPYGLVGGNWVAPTRVELRSRDEAAFARYAPKGRTE